MTFTNYIREQNVAFEQRIRELAGRAESWLKFASVGAGDRDDGRRTGGAWSDAAVMNLTGAVGQGPVGVIGSSSIFKVVF